MILTWNSSARALPLSRLRTAFPHSIPSYYLYPTPLVYTRRLGHTYSASTPTVSFPCRQRHYLTASRHSRLRMSFMRFPTTQLSPMLVPLHPELQWRESLDLWGSCDSNMRTNILLSDLLSNVSNLPLRRGVLRALWSNIFPCKGRVACRSSSSVNILFDEYKKVNI